MNQNQKNDGVYTVKIKLRKVLLGAVILYSTLFPATSLIKDLKDSVINPEDLDEHMFI